MAVLVGVILLLVVAYGGWRWGGEVFPRIQGWAGASAAGDSEPTPELAQETLETVDAFRSDPDAAEMALGAVELASLVRYSVPGLLPEGVSPPVVEMRSGRIHLAAEVAVASFPPLPEVERTVGMLPDTVPVEVVGSIMPFGERGAALIVHRIRMSGIPLPRTLIPRLLGVLGRSDEPGLPPDGLALPLPDGLKSAYILSDSLILVAAR